MVNKALSEGLVWDETRRRGEVPVWQELLQEEALDAADGIRLSTTDF